VWRWRPAYQADFAARTEWCVKPPKECNHPPEVVLNGIEGLDAVEIQSKPGAVVKLHAAGSSDPDGNRLSYRWWVYPEAGSYGKPVAIGDADSTTASITVPNDAVGTTIHVVLEVTDSGNPPLTRYRRAVVAVER
jgi:hypothetical protein